GTGDWTTPFEVEGAVYPKEEDRPQAHIAWVSPGFFDTLGAKVLQGRDFNPQDGRGGLPVMIVNRSLAQRLWPGQDPLGRRLRVFSNPPGDKPEPWRTVVGVVPDLGMVSLEDDEPESQGFYIPVSQDCPSFASVVARTRDPNPLTLTDRVRAHVAALDRDLPIYFVYSLQQV